jgi:hypothetical protein
MARALSDVNQNLMSSQNTITTNKQQEHFLEVDMKKLLSLTLALAFMALLSTLSIDKAHAQSSGNQFGKGAAQQYGPFDDDGDGIPNGQDPDYVKPADGSGHKFGKTNGGAMMNGKGNGNGNRGIGPCDGTGSGSGTGTCDGTGPKGRGGRGK